MCNFDITLIVFDVQITLSNGGVHHYCITARAGSKISLLYIFYCFMSWETYNPTWCVYKKEDGHPWDGFMVFCTR